MSMVLSTVHFHFFGITHLDVSCPSGPLGLFHHPLGRVQDRVSFGERAKQQHIRTLAFEIDFRKLEKAISFQRRI